MRHNEGVDNLTEPLPSAVEGQRAIFDGIERAFATEEAAMNSLSFVNTFLNATIGLLITVAVTTFLLYLLCWIFAVKDTPFQKAAVRGSFRSFIALFFMVSIWGVIRLLQNVVFLSDITAYGAFFLLFFFFGLWSIFGAGNALVSLLARAVEAFSGYILPALRKLGRNRFSDDVLKLAVLIVAAILFSAWSFIPLRDRPRENTIRELPASTWLSSLALIKEKGDSNIHRQTYTNERLGVSITYPEGWEMKELELADHDGLVQAYSEELGIYSRLNAGGFDGVASSTEDSQIIAAWSIQKNILSGYNADSAGIHNAEIYAVGDIGGTPGTYQSLTADWWLPDGTVRRYYDGYYIFGKGPVFFTLQFQTPSDAATFAEANPLVTKILDSIQISEPQANAFRSMQE